MSSSLDRLLLRPTRPARDRAGHTVRRIVIGFTLGLLGGWVYGLLRAPTVTPPSPADPVLVDVSDAQLFTGIPR